MINRQLKKCENKQLILQASFTFYFSKPFRIVSNHCAFSTELFTITNSSSDGGMPMNIMQIANNVQLMQRTRQIIRKILDSLRSQPWRGKCLKDQFLDLVVFPLGRTREAIKKSKRGISHLCQSGFGFKIRFLRVRGATSNALPPAIKQSRTTPFSAQKTQTLQSSGAKGGTYLSVMLLHSH